MAERELMSLEDLTELNRKGYHHYHGTNEPTLTDLEVDALVRTARAAHEWKADYEGAQRGFEAQLTRCFELVDENKKLREQLNMVNTSANMSAERVKCLEMLLQAASRDERDASGKPVAWLVIGINDSYQGLTFTNPQTAEGAFDGMSTEPLYLSLPPLELPSAEELADCMANAKMGTGDDLYLDQANAVLELLKGK